MTNIEKRALQLACEIEQISDEDKQIALVLAFADEIRTEAADRVEQAIERCPRDKYEGAHDNAGIPTRRNHRKGTTMTNIDTIREALERLKGFTYHAAGSQDSDDIKTLIAALSTMTDEQKLAEKYRLIALMNFETALANRELELGGWVSDHAYSIQLLDCQIAELDTDKEEPTP